MRTFWEIFLTALDVGWCLRIFAAAVVTFWKAFFGKDGDE